MADEIFKRISMNQLYRQTQKELTDGLLPCPQCGYDKYLSVRWETYEGLHSRIRVQCDACEYKGKIEEFIGNVKTNWNAIPRKLVITNEPLMKDKVKEFMLNMGGDFPEIWILIEQEIEYNDVDTEEYKLAKYLLDVIGLYVDILR